MSNSAIFALRGDVPFIAQKITLADNNAHAVVMPYWAAKVTFQFLTTGGTLANGGTAGRAIQDGLTVAAGASVELALRQLDDNRQRTIYFAGTSGNVVEVVIEGSESVRCTDCRHLA